MGRDPITRHVSSTRTRGRFKLFPVQCRFKETSQRLKLTVSGGQAVVERLRRGVVEGVACERAIVYILESREEISGGGGEEGAGGGGGELDVGDAGAGGR